MNLCNLATIIFYLSSFALPQSSWYDDYVPSIPAERRVDWRSAGYIGDIPSVYDTVFDITCLGAIANDNIDDAAPIQQAVELARVYNAAHPGARSLVYLPAGTFRLSKAISLVNNSSKNYSNITIKGAGSAETTLYLPKETRSYAFQVYGASAGSLHEVTSGYLKGNDTIYTVTDNINVNDYVELINDYPLQFGKVGQIERVKEKSSSYIVLRNPLAIDYNYNGVNPQIRKMNPVTETGIEDIKIEREAKKDEEDDRYNTIDFYNAANCRVQGVESILSLKHHVSIDASTSIEIRGCYFHESAGYGGGGVGYGVLIQDHSTNCLVEDNLFSKLRHSMLLQSGANRNVFAYNYSWDRKWDLFSAFPLLGTADICLHANYPFANLFEGNKVELIWADDEHPVMNGPYNSFVRNDAALGMIILNLADYTNVIGNYADDIRSGGGPNIPPAGKPSVEVLDVGAKQYNKDGKIYTYTHQDFFSGGSIVQSSSLCEDFSYYYDNVPSYFAAYSPPVTWPPLGTTVQVTGTGVSVWPGGTIPAYERKISGGTLTVPGNTVQIPGQICSDIIAVIDPPIPAEFILRDNFPNPFNPVTTITYDLPDDGFVELKIFDMLGNFITTLCSENKKAGRYYDKVDAASLSSGVYIYTITYQSPKAVYRESKKMVVVK